VCIVHCIAALLALTEALDLNAVRVLLRVAAVQLRVVSAHAADALVSFADNGASPKGHRFWSNRVHREIAQSNAC